MRDIRDLLLASLSGVGVLLIAVGIAALIAVWLVKRLFRLGRDNRAPRLTVEARVSGRRREHRFYGTKYRRTRSTTYHAVFLLNNGMHVELWMNKRSYKRLAEDSAGLLTYQGSHFVKFDPMEEPEDRMKSELTAIPGVGKNMAAHLNALGIERVEDLKGKSPEELYALECAMQGSTVDRCVLYVYRLAVAYAEGRIETPEQLKWWNWKD